MKLRYEIRTWCALHRQFDAGELQIRSQSALLALMLLLSRKTIMLHHCKMDADACHGLSLHVLAQHMPCLALAILK